MSKELTPLEALKDLREIRGWNDKELNKRLDIIENALKRLEQLEEEKQSFDRVLEKKLKVLNEILSLHDKWLGNEMSDFEFFTLLNEVRDKYSLLKEVLYEKEI